MNRTDQHVPPRDAGRGWIAPTLLGAAVAIAGGCSVDGDGALGEVEQAAYVHGAKLWRAPSIPVCWENPTPADAIDREAVKNAVLQTWDAASALHFVGWGPCSASSRGIRIEISDTRPLTWGLGTDLDGRRGGMVLNFTFARWGETCRDQPAHGRCVRAIAIHEFGHAIGFAHEQNRPDNECDQPPIGDDGDRTIGDFDASSVMNYCNTATFSNGSPLSIRDKIAVQRLYGAPSGAIVGHGARCLDLMTVPEGAEADPVRLRRCSDSLNQRWTYRGSELTSFTGEALDVAAEAGAPAKGGGSGRRWEMPDAAILGWGGLCLDAARDGAPAGTSAVLASCDASATQQWTVAFDGGEVRSGLDQCLEARGDGVGAGVELRACDPGRPRQRWRVRPGGQLETASGRCLRAQSSRPGAALALAHCTDGPASPNQKWAFSGALVGAGGRCLDANDGRSELAEGARPHLARCSGDATQDWTYYP